MKLIVLFIFISFNGFAATEDIALSMVPRGKIIDRIGKDYIVKTSAGTKIHVEFKRDGKLQEASGKNLNQGDELEPGDGLISLSSAAQNLTKNGVPPKGIWNLEEDKKLGWIYEIDKSVINAKTGEILIETSANDSLLGKAPR